MPPHLLALAAMLAALMGFANQRGGTCMVAAIEEIVAQRRASRAIALLETSVWVGGSLGLLALLGTGLSGTVGFAPGARALLGGALLGAGALVNQACIFGSVARLGSGQWAYLAVGPGFLLGCLAADGAFDDPAVPRVVMTTPGAIALLLLGVAAALAVYRLWRALARTARGDRRGRTWPPHEATLVIGLSFVALGAVAGPWSYTDWLIALARRGMRADLAQGVLFAAMLSGAFAGGASAGTLVRGRPAPTAVLRCLSGGFCMGLGGLIVPGGNDRLILIGMPLLEPGALLALSAMALTIALGVRLRLANARKSR